MVVLEQGPNSYGAYVPDLPGCVAVGESEKEMLLLIQESIKSHIERLREEGLPVPFPHSSSHSVEVSA